MRGYLTSAIICWASVPEILAPQDLLFLHISSFGWLVIICYFGSCAVNNVCYFCELVFDTIGIELYGNLK